MKFPDKKTMTIGDAQHKIKPYLTSDEEMAIIISCVRIYDEGAKNVDGIIIYDDIPNWDKSILLMEQNFNKCLIELCTDFTDYDYDMLIACGIIEKLYAYIINANSALEKLYKIIDKRDSLPYVVEKGIEKIIKKIPTAKEIDGLYSKVKKDVVSGKMNEAIVKIKDIFDTTKELKK